MVPFAFDNTRLPPGGGTEGGVAAQQHSLRHISVLVPMNSDLNSIPISELLHQLEAHVFAYEYGLNHLDMYLENCSVRERSALIPYRNDLASKLETAKGTLYQLYKELC